MRHTMKQIVFGTALCCAMVVLTTFALSEIGQDDTPAAAPIPVQDPMQEGEGPSAEEQEEMMRLWQEYGTPGEHHEWLAQFVGDWDITMSMTGGESEGHATFSWLLDGRFLLEEVEVETVWGPFTGLGMHGYDNFKQKHVGTWCDSMSTGIYASEGTLDETGTTLVTFGQTDDVVTGMHDKQAMFVLTWVDDDNFTVEMHDMTLVPGETLHAEIAYTRSEG